MAATWHGHLVQYAIVDLAAATADQSIIPAPGASLRIVVLGYVVSAGTAVCTLLFESGTTVALTGIMPLIVGTPFVAQSDVPVFQCAANAALTATTVGAGGTVDGHITYVVMTDP